MPVCVHVSSNKSLLFERTFYNPAGSFSLARGKHPFSMSKRFKRFDESIDEGGEAHRCAACEKMQQSCHNSHDMKKKSVKQHVDLHTCVCCIFGRQSVWQIFSQTLCPH